MNNTLEDLGKIVDEKRKRYEVLGQANCYGLSTEKRVMLDIEYRQAQSEFNQAMSNYCNELQNNMMRKQNTGGINDSH